LVQGGFPARISVAESDTFLKQVLPGTADVYKAYSIAFDRMSDTISEASNLHDSWIDFYWFFRAADRALQGADLDRELANAQATTEQFLACVRSNTKSNICAKQVDPQYEGWQPTS
jgi:hypothetical protein